MRNHGCDLTKSATSSQHKITTEKVTCRKHSDRDQFEIIEQILRGPRGHKSPASNPWFKLPTAAKSIASWDKKDSTCKQANRSPNRIENFPLTQLQARISSMNFLPREKKKQKKNFILLNSFLPGNNIYLKQNQHDTASWCYPKKQPERGIRTS